jgi:hypothetical protein
MIIGGAGDSRPAGRSLGRQFFDQGVGQVGRAVLVRVQRDDAARFATALLDRVDDPTLTALPLTGAVDQYVDSTDVLSRPQLTREIMAAVVPSRTGAVR